MSKMNLRNTNAERKHLSNTVIEEATTETVRFNRNQFSNGEGGGGRSI